MIEPTYSGSPTRQVRISLPSDRALALQAKRHVCGLGLCVGDL
jgi:hypothetical protein